MDVFRPLNLKEQKFYPLPLTSFKCKTVWSLAADERFQYDLDALKQQLSTQDFMTYFYKTAICPLENEKHDWAECNYSHRQ